MKIGILQLNFKIGDFSGNMSKVLDGYHTAVEKGAELVVASELALFGYPPGDMLLRQDYLAQQNRCLEQLGQQIGPVGLVIGAALKTGQDFGMPLYNSAMLIQNREIVFVQPKSLLPNYDVFDEKRYFEPWGQAARVLSYNGMTFGLLICEDIWRDVETIAGHPMYQNDPLDAFLDRDIDVLITINASPFCIGKSGVRLEIAQSIANRLNCSVIYVNQVGGNDELVFDGHSFAVGQNGQLLARAKGFRPACLVVDTGKQSGCHEDSGDDTRELLAALILGTRDYLCKSGGHPKALVALSGGIDSAVTACIASQAVGPENVLGIAMPSAFSSEGSILDARLLAENLGIPFELIPIDTLFTRFGEVLEPVIGWGLPGEKDKDVTEENIQARIRGTVMMAISNREGGIVLSTGNKSELSVGYCTLYGDMVGGFAVLSDVFKTRVYDLARYINRNDEIIPWNTIHKPPSAELSPGQTDQDALPPYDILDPILQAYIEKDMTEKEIRTAGYDPSIVSWVIARVNANEYKRRQMAPGLKITQKAFGCGRRMPIAARFHQEI